MIKKVWKKDEKNEGWEGEKEGGLKEVRIRLKRKGWEGKYEKERMCKKGRGKYEKERMCKKG